MKVCILSDSHDHIALLDAAVADAKPAGAEAVLHCGDLVAASTLHCLEKYGLPVHVIHGNNTGDLYALTRLADKPVDVIRFHGMDAGIELLPGNASFWCTTRTTRTRWRPPATGTWCAAVTATQSRMPITRTARG